MTENKTINWNAELVDQLDWQWQNLLRPRLDGLTDDEYFWEPVPGCWSVRPRDANLAAGAVDAMGTGAFVLEYGPDLEVPPVTTIAWRLAHVTVGCLGMRAAGHFGGPPCDWRTFDYAGTAKDGLLQLDGAYAAWTEGARGLGEEGLTRPCGPAAGPYADYPLAAMILHINREVLHHGAEIALLRDLYRWKGTDVQAL
jgi:hypothetical protein